MATAVVDFVKSHIPLILAAPGAAGAAPSRPMSDTPAYAAASKVSDPDCREKLQKAAEWAAKRTPTEVRDLERGVSDAIAQRVRRG